MPRIKDKDYNDARALLMANGSITAQKSHPHHNKKGGDCPEKYGKNLLNEAYFIDWNGAPTLAQLSILQKAAGLMNIDWEP